MTAALGSRTPLVALRRRRVDAGRRQLQLTWREFATRCGVSVAYVHAVVGGQSPGGQLWERLAEALSCSLAWLMDGQGPAPVWGADLPRTPEEAIAQSRQTPPIVQQRTTGPFYLPVIPRSLVETLPHAGALTTAGLVSGAFGASSWNMPPLEQGSAWATVGSSAGEPLWAPSTEVLLGPAYRPGTHAARIGAQACLAAIQCADDVGTVRLGMWAPSEDGGTLFQLRDLTPSWRGRLGAIAVFRCIHGVVERRPPAS